MKQAQGPNGEELIWITDAMVVYQHNRDWFQERINDGRLTKVSVPGEASVYLRQAELKALGEEPTFMPEKFICKAEGCDELGNHCGMCGNYSCEAHGHEVESHSAGIAGVVGAVDVPDVVIESWICDDCARGLVEEFKRNPPKPIRMGW